MFTDLHSVYGNSLEKKFHKMLLKIGIENFIKKGELVAIKVHVGERGNLGYLNHNFARVVVEAVKKAGAKPYLTDTNTLYSGGRHNAVDHCETATQHGFSYLNTGASFIPADGLRGLDFSEVEINQKNVKKAKLAGGILQADKIIFLTHFKGHIEAGFGGTIKNMAMGCAAVPGKMEQHSSLKPVVKEETCVGCRQCYNICPQKAISMNNNKARINHDLCVGCGQCVAACNFNSIPVSLNVRHETFIEKICEYAYAVDQYFGNRALYVNFALNITPDCDCWPANDVPIVQDAGILASFNPLALDRATLDKVNACKPNPSSIHAVKIKNQKNIFMETKPDLPSDYIFEYCSTMGMSDAYELKIVE